MTVNREVVEHEQSIDPDDVPLYFSQSLSGSERIMKSDSNKSINTAAAISSTPFRPTANIYDPQRSGSSFASNDSYHTANDLSPLSHLGTVSAGELVSCPLMLPERTSSLVSSPAAPAIQANAAKATNMSLSTSSGMPPAPRLAYRQHRSHQDLRSMALLDSDMPIGSTDNMRKSSGQLMMDRKSFLASPTATQHPQVQQRPVESEADYLPLPSSSTTVAPTSTAFPTISSSSHKSASPSNLVRQPPQQQLLLQQIQQSHPQSFGGTVNSSGRSQKLNHPSLYVQTSSLSIPSLQPIHPSPSLPAPSAGHSRQQSFSQSHPQPLQHAQTITSTTVPWPATDPNQWTNERVLLWLEAGKFGQDWLDAFRQRNIHGDDFFALINYQNLKKLGHLSQKNQNQDTSPSRFIHNLRRVLHRSLGPGSSPFASQELDIDSIAKPSLDSGPYIVRPTPESSPVKSNSDQGSPSKHYASERLSPENISPAKPGSDGGLSPTKPNSGYTSSSASPSWPDEASSMHGSHGNFSNSALSASTSSISRIQRRPVSRPFSLYEQAGTIKLSSSPSSGQPSAMPPASPSFRPFFRRHHKSNSSESSITHEDLLSSGMPSLPAPTTSHDSSSYSDSRKGRGLFGKLRRKDHRSKSRDSRLDSPTSPVAEMTTTRKVPSTIAEKYVVDPKYRPRKNTLSHVILVTLDNRTFTLMDISQATSVSDVRSMIAQRFSLDRAGHFALHLTDFNCRWGDALEETVLRELIKLPIHEDPLKLYVSGAALAHVSNTPVTASSAASVTSISSAASSSQPPSSSTTTSVTNSTSLSVATPTSVVSSGSPSSILPQKPLAEPNESFKVIRSTKREINFDDRRISPYDRKPSLVALRNAPPPPLNRTSSIKVKVTVSTESLPIADKSGFSPGQSETLIPLPYVGRQNAVVRKPVRKSSSRRIPSKGSLSSMSSNDKLRTDVSSTKGTAATTATENKETYLEEKFSVRETASAQSSSTTSHNENFSFTENEISFADAPAFVSDSGSDDTDDDLWAKAPAPVPRQDRPELTVETSLGDHQGQLSSVPSSSQLSPVRIRDENGEQWVVRPPAEVVYDNLERFFPNADLDKPIIDDPRLSPVAEPTSTTSTTEEYWQNYLPAKVFPARTEELSFKEQSKQKEQNDREVETQLPQASSQAHSDENTLTLERPVSGSSTDMQKKSEYRGSVNNTDLYPRSERNSQKISRLKSLRVVAREASEARKRQSSGVSNQKSGALLRRKSTKMWGQRVVEMTPSEISKGNLSLLRDQKGEFKKFIWVKGELIGKGTFGKVYLALNATTGEMMAVKQVEVPQTASDRASSRQREVIDALHSEVETLKDLDHLNIVQYLGFEALDDVYNLFLEYVPGGSVGRVLNMYGRFEEPIIKHLMYQVLDGLSYLHSCNILHRDLKADNLLLDLDGVCKISDFGISKKSRDIYANDAEMSMQGTIFWMAPEVIHNVVHNEKQGYSAKVDVWSLGCVLLEMFAGRRPWSTDEAIGAMYKLGTSRLAPPIPEDTKPFVSDEGNDFLNQCFAIDAEKRPTAQQLRKHPFCKVDPSFDFSKTKLAEMIRFNNKKREGIKHPRS